MIRRWLQRQAHKRDEKARRVEARTWAIFREIADPLVAEGLARLSWPTVAPGPWKDAEPSRCAALEPTREGAASVSVEPVGSAWINLAVGEPFPDGWVYELEVYKPDWEDKLRLCLEAVVDGRYSERVYEKRNSLVHEMVFDLAKGEKTSVRDAWIREEALGEGLEPGERRYLPYRG
jgi:hypothetical protein